MSDKLLIRLLEGQYVEWAYVDKHGKLLAAPVSGRLEEIPKLENPCVEIIVLVSSFQVSLHEVKLPSSHRKHQLQAVPFVLEEYLLEDVEEYFFASATKCTADKLLPVAVVRRANLIKWLEKLNSVGLQPDVMLPEVFALECKQGECAVYVEGSKALVRTGEFSGFAVDEDNLNEFLKEYPEDKINFIDKNLLEQLADQQQHKPSLNILQREFQVEKLKNDTPWYASKQTCLILLVILLLSLVLGKGVRYVSLHHVLGAQRQKISSIYKKTFPHALLPADPKLSMNKRLTQLRQSVSGDPVLQAVAKLGEVLKKYPSLKVAALQYDNQTLVVGLPMLNLQWQRQLIDALHRQELKLDYAYKDNVLTLKIKV